MAPIEETNENTLSASTLLIETMCSSSVGDRRLELAAGETIHQAGQVPEHVYVIHSGQVRVYQEREPGSARLLEILGPGDWFGASALAGAQVYGTVARAQSASVVQAINVAALHKRLLERPEALSELVRQLSNKLRVANEQAGSLVFDDCNSRLIRTLIQFSQSAAASRNSDGVTLKITHQQLAQAVGAARETVSLALTQFRHMKLLETGRNQLFFKPEALEEFYRRTPSAAGCLNTPGSVEVAPSPIQVPDVAWSTADVG